MNYTDILTAIKSYSGRTDSDALAAMPGFIAQIQSKLDQQLRIAPMLEFKTYPITGKAVTVDDLLEVESVFIDDEEGALASLRHVLASRKLPKADPLIFAMTGRTFVLAGDATELAIHGYTRPIPISANNANNVYADYAPNAIIFGALSYLAVWAMDDENLQKYDGLTSAEIETLNEVSEALSMAGTIQPEVQGYV